MPRLFEMFSRADRNTARHQGGLGIGLPLSRRLAEMHDGTLQAHSEGLGRGSAFTLRVPAAEAPVVAPPAMVPHETQLNKLRVLVIDDNQDAASSMAELLSVFGAEPRAAYSGADGLAMFDTWRPAVVLLDIGMPKMNGYDVARAIRSRPDGHNVTLVALTGWAQEDDRLLASEAGFEHHLVKPVEIHLLLRLLEDVAG
jgi:CheY-like chemotaxis protein